MNEYTASNDYMVRVRATGTELAVEGGFGILHVSKERTQALREFFRAEEDERLGRFRHGEYVVYPDGEDQLGNRHVVTVWEKNGRRDSIYEDNIPNTVYGASARAYFDAHPEPKPWHNAKPGEVWVLTVDGAESAFYPSKSLDRAFTPVTPGTGRTAVSMDSFEITAGRRIYPEDDS